MKPAHMGLVAAALLILVCAGIAHVSNAPQPADAKPSPEPLPAVPQPSKQEQVPEPSKPEQPLPPPPEELASPAASPAPSGPSTPKTAPAPDPLGYDEAPEQALARDLDLTPEQAEAVGQVMRECNAELDREMLELMERSYDQVVAKRLAERHQARVLERVEAVLPADVRPRFRELMARQAAALDQD